MLAAGNGCKLLSGAVHAKQAAAQATGLAGGWAMCRRRRSGIAHVCHHCGGCAPGRAGVPGATPDARVMQ